MKESIVRENQDSYRESSRDWQSVLIFYVVAAMMRLALMVLYVRVPWLFNDEVRYMREARSLALYHQFGIDGFSTFFDRPLYPLLISVFGRMPDTDLALVWIRVLNVMVMSTTIWGAWWLARQILGRKESLWTAAIIAAWPLGFFTSVVMTENLLFPLAVFTSGAMCWAWGEWLEKEGEVSPVRQLLLGALLCAIYYTHGRGVLFVASFPSVFVWFSFRRGLTEARGGQHVWRSWPVHMLRSLLRVVWEWRYTILLVGAAILLWMLRSRLAGDYAGSSMGSGPSSMNDSVPKYYQSYAKWSLLLLSHPGLLVHRLLRIAAYYWCGGYGVVALGAMVFLLSKPQGTGQYVLWVLVIALLLMHMGLAACTSGHRLQGRYASVIWPVLVVAAVWAFARCTKGWRVAVATLVGLVVSYFFPALNVLRGDAVSELSDMVLYKYLMHLSGATVWTTVCAFILLGAGCWFSKRRLMLVGSLLLLLWIPAQWIAFREGASFSLGKRDAAVVQVARRVQLLAGGADRTLTVLVDRPRPVKPAILYCKFYSQARFIQTNVNALLRRVSDSPSGKLVMFRTVYPEVPSEEVAEAQLLLSRRDIQGPRLIFRSGHLRLYQLRPVVFPEEMSPGRLTVRVPSKVKAGYNLILPIGLQNRSRSAWWHRDPYHVVVKQIWETEQGELVRRSDRPLENPLYPGGRRTLLARITSPQPGRYRLRWEIVCKGHGKIELVSPCVFDVEVRP